MSYDLCFWKYRESVSLDHQRVYERLCDGEEVEGLETLPITQVVARIRSTFAGWQQLDECTFDGGDRGTFQLYTTPQLLRVDCYGMNGDDMNVLIDIARSFGCQLYDPQVGQRYD